MGKTQRGWQAENVQGKGCAEMCTSAIGLVPWEERERSLLTVALRHPGSTGLGKSELQESLALSTCWAYFMEKQNDLED